MASTLTFGLRERLHQILTGAGLKALQADRSIYCSWSADPDSGSKPRLLPILSTRAPARARAPKEISPEKSRQSLLRTGIGLLQRVRVGCTRKLFLAGRCVPQSGSHHSGRAPRTMGVN